jgi:hypothetical protein
MVSLLRYNTNIYVYFLGVFVGTVDVKVTEIGRELNLNNINYYLTLIRDI